MLPSYLNVMDLGIFAFVLVISLLLILFFLVDFNAKRHSSSFSSLPGIDATDPDKGNFDDMKDAGSLHEFLVNLHDEYGPLASFWWGPQLVVSLGSPEMFNEVKTIFDRPKVLFEAFSALTGKKSIQYANGPLGREKRQLMDQSFSHESVVHYYDHFIKVADEVADEWASLPAEQHIPLTQIMVGMSIKVLTLSILGQDMADDKELLKLIKAYDVCWAEMEQQLVSGSMPEEGDGRVEKFNENRDFMRDLIKRIIKKRRSEKNKEDYIFLDSLLDTDFIDKDELVDHCISFFIGGFHTTGNVMTWCLYYLATHQDIQEKVYQELLTVLGEETISAQIIPELTYTRQVIDETMRCSVLAPWAARVADYDLQIGEHLIPKETPIITALGVVLKNEDVWPDPDRFDPDRFSVENSKKRHPMAFQPFGFAGKRKCPGYRFAYAEAIVILSVILHRFKIDLVEGQVIKPVYRLVTSPSDEIWATISKR